jgi:phosphoenolpyruvate carboxykinase (ATP)
VKFRREPFFGLEVPLEVPAVPADVLDPKKSWSDAAAYDAQAKKLAVLFANNFKRFEKQADPAVNAIAIKP